MVPTDKPIIRCKDKEAEVGEKNVVVECEVRAKPEVVTLFWRLNNSRPSHAGVRSNNRVCVKLRRRK